MSDALKLFAPKFTINDVTIHEKKRTYKKIFAMDEYKVSYKHFDGSTSPILDRHIFERDRDASVVLPYDPNTDEVCMIEQFRPGALKDKISPWLVEVVAGLIDDGETPEQAALRELKEEAKIEISPENLHFCLGEYPSPGGISEYVTIYIATCDLSHLSNHGGLESESEDIRVFKAKFEDAYNQIATGGIRNSATIIALMYLKLNYDKFKKA
ncbi:MAG: NUDIX domain-containing protein [Succinatimonas sp.]|nr:NUDIX domain-containing protein [Succinatimonas sp.]